MKYVNIKKVYMNACFSHTLIPKQLRSINIYSLENNN